MSTRTKAPPVDTPPPSDNGTRLARIRKQADALIEIGTSGLKHTHGRITEEPLRQLQGSRALKAYDEMRLNDPVVSSGLFAIEMMIRQTAWTVQPASQDPLDIDNAAFIEGALQDMSHTWEDTLSEVLTMMAFGFAPLEIVYKKREGEGPEPGRSSRFDDGRWGWRKLPLRAQRTVDRWLIDYEGGIQGLVQRAGRGGTLGSPVEIPIDKLLLFRTTTNMGNPEGRSLLRHAWRPWYFKKRLEEIEAIGAERDLAGLPVAHVPPEILHPNADADLKAVRAHLEEVVANVRRDEHEGMLFPMSYDQEGNRLYDFTLLTTGGTRQFDVGAIVKHKNLEILLTMMADFLLVGHESTGSFALMDRKGQTFNMAIGAWMDSIAAVFNRHAIPRLMRLNGMPVAEGMPTLGHDDVEAPSLEDLGVFLNRTAAAGLIMPTPEIENALLDRAGLPTREPEGL